jgi:hypothetical protein
MSERDHTHKKSNQKRRADLYTHSGASEVIYRDEWNKKSKSQKPFWKFW